MRLIDADELMEHVYRDKLDSRELIAKMVKNAQPIDAVPVIRCKECKNLLPNDRIAPNWWRICDYWRTGVDENEYCSHGERKEK